jgi:hypothetical protein
MTEMYLEGFPNPFPRGPDGVWAVPRVLQAADFPGVPGTDSPQGEAVMGRKPMPGTLPGAAETDDIEVIRDFRPFVPPAAVAADGGDGDDPKAGEEFLEQPPVTSHGSPAEMNMGILNQYRCGADGICFHNQFMDNLEIRRCGHTEEIERRVLEGVPYGQQYGQPIITL